MSSVGRANAERPAATSRPVVGVGLRDDLRALLADRYRLCEWPSSFDPEAPVMVVQHARVGAAEMDRQPGLRLIGVFGVGYDRVDVAAATARGVTLFNTPGVVAPCTADMAMALLLAVGREVLSGDRYVRDGRWPQGRRPPARRFSGRTLGILGLGAVGMAVARRAAAFDLDIGYHNRRRRADVAWRYHETPEALARASDYLVVACPATPETHHLVDASVLAALGPDGIVVNIARGPIVDEAALIAALASGAIKGAGLDVVEHEPQVPAALLALPNVVLTPHVGGHTQETADDIAALILANIDAYFATGMPITPVAL